MCVCVRAHVCSQEKRRKRKGSISNMKSTSCSRARRRSCKAFFRLSRLVCRTSFPLACKGKNNNMKISPKYSNKDNLKEKFEASTSSAILFSKSVLVTSSLWISTLHMHQKKKRNYMYETI
jgi:hypothetical protein